MMMKINTLSGNAITEMIVEAKKATGGDHIQKI